MGSVSSRSQSLLVDALAAQALSLRTHYQETNDVKYLDHLISNEQAILKFLPERDTRRFETCTRLAHLRNDLDTRTGGESVLKRDVEQWRVLCAHNPVDHPLRVEAFSNLATALRKLYSHTNDIRLLDEATDIHREALALHLPGHPDRATSCSNLASSLSTRYDRTGDMRLLDEATELQREALALTPSGNPDYAPYCTNLAIFLESRHKQAGDTELLDEAIELKRKALAQFSSGDRDRAGFCTNLAYSLHTRYNETGDIGLLSEAIVLDREALHWQWPGDPDRAGCCTNLAVSLKALSMVTHDMRLLEEAISLDREALTLRPPSHPDHSLYCINLALSLERQYGHTKDDHLLEEAIDLSHEAADYSSPSRVWRSWTLQCHLYLRQRSTSNLAITRASSALQRCADLEADNITYFMDNIATELNSLWSFRPDWNCDIPSLLVSVYVDLVNRLPLIAAFVLNTSSRLLALQSFSHLGSQACVVAIEAGKFELALELLDHSHGVIWAQALHQRNPEFADAPSELASELDTLLRAINAPATTLSAGHLTSRDNQHVQNSRIYSILREIRAMPGLDRFMRGKAFDELRQVARTHPVALLVLIDNETYAVIVKDASQEHPDVLKLGVTSEQIVSLLGQTRQMGFSDRSSSEGEWREAWSEPLADLSEPHSSERYMLPQVSRQSFVGLRDIWNTIVKPIFIHVGLKKSEGNQRPRFHWCPTGHFAFIPLYAAGIYAGHNQECSSDYVVASYTPTLSSLLRVQRQNPSATLRGSNMVLLSSSPLSSGGFVALPEVAAEIAVITDIASKANVTPNALSATQHATSDITDALTQASIVHIACHGSQDAGNPLESAFHLSGDRKITVSDLMELHLQDAHLAFLSACHTAKGDSKQPDQSIHLAAAMLFVGFKSVIGTMWAMKDEDGPIIAEAFYHKLLGSDTISTDAIPRALDDAVRALKATGAGPERWATFMHVGA